MQSNWLDGLDPEKFAEAESKLNIMKQFEVADADEWIKSEIEENIPQLARFLVLRGIWPELIDVYRDQQPVWIQGLVKNGERDPKGHFGDAGVSLKRMLGAGVKESDIANLARFIAYETAFGVLEIIDEGYDPEAPEEAPNWTLMEIDSEDHLTGRQVGGGLHESILSLDPSGLEGKPGNEYIA